MDPTKKRKLEENGVVSGADRDFTTKLTQEDARKMVERFTQDQLLDVLQTAIIRHPDVLDAVRSVADSDPTQRKLFIRGLGWETTTENLRNLFSTYGELEEAVVILDKNTGKSKGYGFVIYKHVDGAILALKEPSKKIDGRVTVTQYAAAGSSGGGRSSTNSNVGGDVSLRKIYVANVPYEMAADKLLAHFAQYGEIEEGPLGFDKLTGKSRGFALFVYKSVEGAQSALAEPVKMIEGRQLNCKLANDGKKGKPGGPTQAEGGQGQVQGNGMGMGMGSQGPYGGPSGPGGMGSYGGYSGGLQGGPPHHHGMPSQGPGPLTAGGGYGGSMSGAGGPYSGYGGPGSSAYGGYGGGTGGSGMMGAASAGLENSGGAGSNGGVGSGSSLYRMPPTSVGMPSGGYPEAGHYTANFPTQHHGTSPAPRVPPGGMYPNMPPYY